MAQAVPTSAAPAPATAKPPAAALRRSLPLPGLPRRAMPKLLRPLPPLSPLRPLPPQPPPHVAKPSEASASASCCEANCFDVLRRVALHLRRPLPGSLQQGLHFGGSPDDLRRRHLVGRRRQSRRPPGDPQRAVQPVASAPQDVEGLVLGDASSRSCSARSSSRNDRLSRLNAALPQPAPERRGPRRV